MNSRLANVIGQINSPAFVIDEQLLLKNMKVVNRVQTEAGVTILCALKGFSMYSMFPLMKGNIGGITASSLNEALLGFEEFGEKVHSCCPVYLEHQFEKLQSISSHITFNSLEQFRKFKPQLREDIDYALRINPEYSEVEVDLYNPCSPTSRLGIPYSELPDELPSEITGLHFHALCENDSYTLERTLNHFAQLYDKYLRQVQWVNFGGGHLMTREGYNLDHLIEVIKNFKQKYGIDIILEPGSAHAWQTGYLVTKVEDTFHRGGRNIAMLNTSFTAHMPDCLEMPYKPSVIGEKEWGEWSYTFGGCSCLAGDQISGFVFDRELKAGDTLVFKDMIHYTMVKTTTFNGVDLPDIGSITEKGDYKVIKSFGYNDFKRRL